MSVSGDHIRYVGFAVVADGREYQFRVAGDHSGDPERAFTFWIATADFCPGRLKFQEGPDITLRKLKSLLAGEQEEAPLRSHQKLTESDITNYTATNSSKSKTVTEEQRQAARDRYRNRLG